MLKSKTQKLGAKLVKKKKKEELAKDDLRDKYDKTCRSTHNLQLPPYSISVQNEKYTVKK